jgi:hypothetical protein
MAGADRPVDLTGVTGVTGEPGARGSAPARRLELLTTTR